MASFQFLSFNGRVVEQSEVTISPFDHGLLTGDGIFETLRSYQGKVFALHRHYLRMQQGADLMGLKVPGESEIKQAIDSILVANDIADARIRVTVTSGDGPLASDRDDSEITVVVAASELPQQDSVAQVSIASKTRNESGFLTGIKSTSYAENVVALREAKQQGCSEAILGNTAGNLCEGTGSNIFLVLEENEGRLLTPTLASGCLPGVTRALVIELAEQLGIPVEEVDVPLGTVAGANEAFLSGTIKEIQAIGEIGDTVLPHAPGPVTRRIQQAFAQLTQENCDP